MLGVNHRDRNTPVTRSTTKLHKAISPSMNDQWSGKTFRRYLRPPADRLSRSSAQPATVATARRSVGMSRPFRDVWLSLSLSDTTRVVRVTGAAHVTLGRT